MCGWPARDVWALGFERCARWRVASSSAAGIISFPRAVAATRFQKPAGGIPISDRGFSPAEVAALECFVPLSRQGSDSARN